MSFTIYDKTTGEVLRTGIATNPAAQVLYMNEAFVPEECDPDKCYVKNGVIKMYPSPAPGLWAAWDLETEQWVDMLTPEEHAEMEATERENQFELLRQERDRRLQASDWTDTVSARKRLSQDVQDAWDAYRMALRDLPDNTVDPTNVEWPVPPTK